MVRGADARVYACARKKHIAMIKPIHKLNITAGATFDINEVLGLILDRRDIRAQVEEYITHQEAAGRLPWWGYFRCNYLDEVSGELLRLFVYRRERLGLMQFWELAGVSGRQIGTRN